MYKRTYRAKPSRCTKCGRPRRGHEGPCGLRCSMAEVVTEIVTENNSENDWQDDVNSNRAESPTLTLDTQSPFVIELARQMSELTANVSRILAKQPTTQHGTTTRQRTQHSDATPSKHTTPKTPSCPGACCTAGTNDLPVALSNGARVTRKTITNAKAGEFTNLIDFMPTSEPSNILETAIDETTGNLTFKAKSVKKSIDNFLMWTLAWSGYEELLVEADFTRYRACVAYRLFIQKQNAVYNWAAVEQYDGRFRHNLSMSRSFEFNRIDTDLGFSIFNSTSLRPNPQSCFRCKSLLHHVRDCPFPETHSVEKAPTTQKTNFRPPRYNQYNGNAPQQGPQSRFGNNYARSREVCYNFNSGRCTDSSTCGRLHVCSGCGGPDPLPRCRKCSGAGPPNSAYPPQAGAMGAPHVNAPR
jgi:hypothetical protein